MDNHRYSRLGTVIDEVYTLLTTGTQNCELLCNNINMAEHDMKNDPKHTQGIKDQNVEIPYIFFPLTAPRCTRMSILYATFTDCNPCGYMF
jgi:hypothetical protein